MTIQKACKSRRVIDGQITFVKDLSSTVTGLIFVGPGGQNMTGTRVK